jgi:alcohol dehydrogenase class IV
MGEIKAFYSPTRIVTGLGCIRDLGRETDALGTKALLVCSPGGGVASGLSGTVDRQSVPGWSSL